MDAKTIMTEWLVKHGFGGLKVPGEYASCGCDLKNLMTCPEGMDCRGCAPAYRIPTPDDEYCSYMMAFDKPLQLG